MVLLANLGNELPWTGAPSVFFFPDMGRLIEDLTRQPHSVNHRQVHNLLGHRLFQREIPELFNHMMVVKHSRCGFCTTLNCYSENGASTFSKRTLVWASITSLNYIYIYIYIHIHIHLHIHLHIHIHTHMYVYMYTLYIFIFILYMYIVCNCVSLYIYAHTWKQPQNPQCLRCLIILFPHDVESAPQSSRQLEVMKSLLLGMASTKLNVLHWHLTDAHPLQGTVALGNPMKSPVNAC